MEEIDLYNYSVFKKWIKHDLIDIMEKIGVPDVYTGLKKRDLVVMLEDHLLSLDNPMDDVIDYPELQEFYKSKNFLEHGTNYVKAQEFDEDTDNELRSDDEINDQEKNDDTEGSNTKESDNNSLNDDVDDSSDDDSDKNYRDQEQTPENEDYDIIDNVVYYHEVARDNLSNIYTLQLVFYIFELLKVITYNHTTSFSAENFALNLGWWLLTSVILPCLVSYFVNFIRNEEPELQCDPMVFSITKSLVSYTMMHIDYHEFHSENILVKSLSQTSDALTNLPMIFGFINIILTLYIF